MFSDDSMLCQLCAAMDSSHMDTVVISHEMESIAETLARMANLDVFSGSWAHRGTSVVRMRRWKMPSGGKCVA